MSVTAEDRTACIRPSFKHGNSGDGPCHGYDTRAEVVNT
ncbi:hypothetical protein P376_0716 [Streptomyces sp. HCCB10043]|nr:hypothetical protein P376_0716 [Streptomyces sp. HCCB10043]